MLFEEVENDANLLERSFFCVFIRVFLFFCFNKSLFTKSPRIIGLSCNLQL